MSSLVERLASGGVHLSVSGGMLYISVDVAKVAASTDPSVVALGTITLPGIPLAEVVPNILNVLREARDYVVELVKHHESKATPAPTPAPAVPVAVPVAIVPAQDNAAGSDVVTAPPSGQVAPDMQPPTACGACNGTGLAGKSILCALCDGTGAAS